MALAGAATAQDQRDVSPKASRGYPPHIELLFLDKDKKLFVVAPGNWAVAASPSLKSADFYVDEDRMVYVFSGNGHVSVGGYSIEVKDDELTINGASLDRSTKTAVLRPDGTIVPNGFIATFK